MKISQKGLYALQAMMVLTRRYTQGAIRSRDIAYEKICGEVPGTDPSRTEECASCAECARRQGRIPVAPAPSEIRLSEIIRLIDGPLAPFGDASQLRILIDRDADHSALYKVFLEARDAAAQILENTTLADLIISGLRLIPVRR